MAFALGVFGRKIEKIGFHMVKAMAFTMRTLFALAAPVWVAPGERQPDRLPPGVFHSVGPEPLFLRTGLDRLVFPW